MDSQQLLEILKERVPRGMVTIYGELSFWAYGNHSASQAIVAMLNAAVGESFSNAQYTNRVVSKKGKIVNVNGQLNQLTREGVAINIGNVDMQKADIVYCKERS